MDVPRDPGLCERPGYSWRSKAGGIPSGSFWEVSVWTEWSPARALLHVQGQILAEAASDCELYVVYDNHTLHYQRLTVNAGQTPFSIEVPCPRIYVWDIQEGQPAALHYVQLELADRSVLLDARCCYVGFRSCSWEETRQAIRLNKHLLPVGTALPIVDIQTPVAEGKPFESADEIGQPFCAVCHCAADMLPSTRSSNGPSSRCADWCSCYNIIRLFSAGWCIPSHNCTMPRWTPRWRELSVRLTRNGLSLSSRTRSHQSSST
jgi:hypothetical protein